MIQDSQIFVVFVFGMIIVIVFDEGVFQVLGLVCEDLLCIVEICLELDDLCLGNLQVFGCEVVMCIVVFFSQLLDQVCNCDLDVSGEKLGEVVCIVCSLKLDGFVQCLKVLVIGGLIDCMWVFKGELVQKFSDINVQIEQLLVDVGVQQVLMGKCVGEFDCMYDIVCEECCVFGLYVVVGKQWLVELQVEQLVGQGSEDFQQCICQGEIDNVIWLIEKCVLDLQLMQYVVDQLLLMICLIQVNVLQLIEKFNIVCDIIILLWKCQFVIQLLLGEQKVVVELFMVIDDVINELMCCNVDLLCQVLVDIVCSNQCGVIDVVMLCYVYDQLIVMVEEVCSIYCEGMQQWQQVEVELLCLCEDL